MFFCIMWGIMMSLLILVSLSLLSIFTAPTLSNQFMHVNKLPCIQSCGCSAFVNILKANNNVIMRGIVSHNEKQHFYHYAFKMYVFFLKCCIILHNTQKSTQRTQNLRQAAHYHTVISTSVLVLHSCYIHCKVPCLVKAKATTYVL